MPGLGLDKDLSKLEGEGLEKPTNQQKQSKVNEQTIKISPRQTKPVKINSLVRLNVTYNDKIEKYCDSTTLSPDRHALKQSSVMQ